MLQSAPVNGRTIEPRVLKGFRDFLPEEESPRTAMLRAVARAFETCGFAPLQTPAIEYLDILTGKYGEEGEKLLYRFKDHGERDVALRYDLTVPLARVVALHRDLPRPFKRYQIGTVWRAEKPAHGRFREFVQCDADIVGSASPLADADCVMAGVLALEALGVDFEVRIGHRGVLNAVLRQCGVVNPGLQVAVLRVVDKADKVGWDEVGRLVADLVGPDTARALCEAIRSGGARADLESLAPEAMAHLRAVTEALEHLGIARRVRLDFSIARGLDYYTGTVFETVLRDLPGVGSVMSGGRYDGLTRLFGDEDCPAVGLSIGVDRLFSALQEIGRLPGTRCGPVAVVCPVGDGTLAAALGLLADLRAAGIASEAVPDPSWRLKKSLQYAARRAARFALIVGEAEVAARTVTVKDLDRGTQETLTCSDAVSVVRRTLAGGEDGRAD